MGALGLSDAHALAALGVGAGALASFALFALFRRLDGRDPLLPTAVAMLSPLYWFTASRPLSDVTGLASALGVQALTLSATGDAALLAACFLAAFAAGLRSQVLWLTVPLLVLAIARRPRAARPRSALGAAAAFLAGGLTWGIPLVALSGGPGRYWHAVFDQGAEDLSGIQMLWTTPTAREALSALYFAFVAPWATAWLGAVVIVCALAGARRVWRDRETDTAALVVAFGPYLLFDVLFQETFTTRYALPLVVPIAYLAVRGAATLPRIGTVVPIGIAAASLAIAMPSLAAYSAAEAPAFRLLADMRARQAAGSSLPVVGMHRREDLDLRRPLQWVGGARPRWSVRLPAPPKLEWQPVLDYWRRGGTDTLWFVADPLRTEFAAGPLALIDPLAGRDVRRYRWPLGFHELVGGVRPDVMDWYTIDAPGWIAGAGWALTPEAAGQSTLAGRGPAAGPIEAWIRRRPGAATLMFGGRNFADGDRVARVAVAIDGRTVARADVAPGFFVQLTDLPDGALSGDGVFARLTLASTPGLRLEIEQFDLQSPEGPISAFGDGWHEQEFNPRTGLLWRWMSERAELRVHAGADRVMLHVSGESPLKYFARPSRLVIRAGSYTVLSRDVASDFDFNVEVPHEALAPAGGVITLETDQVYVPADRSRRTADRRRLGLRIFRCELRPAARPAS